MCLSRNAGKEASRGKVQTRIAWKLDQQTIEKLTQKNPNLRFLNDTFISILINKSATI